MQEHSRDLVRICQNAANCAQAISRTLSHPDRQHAMRLQFDLTTESPITAWPRASRSHLRLSPARTSQQIALRGRGARSTGRRDVVGKAERKGKARVLCGLQQPAAGRQAQECLQLLHGLKARQHSMRCPNLLLAATLVHKPACTARQYELCFHAPNLDFRDDLNQCLDMPFMYAVRHSSKKSKESS